MYTFYDIEFIDVQSSYKLNLALIFRTFITNSLRLKFENLDGYFWEKGENAIDLFLLIYC